MTACASSSSAGEVSGDQHGSALLAALKDARSRTSRPSASAATGCAAQGMRLLAHQKDLAIIGVVEALREGPLRPPAHPRPRRPRPRTRRSTPRSSIDSPDFNLPLARRLAKAGVPVVFYVSPQVWAWRSGRAKTLARLGRGILTLFRFEKRWYDARGLGGGVTWVGHPLVDEAARELAIAGARLLPRDAAASS